jgi:hypothetical protein
VVRAVIHPDDDPHKNHTSICDVSGDASILNSLISRLTPVVRWCSRASTSKT